MAQETKKTQAAPAINFSQDAGRGQESVTMENLAKPFLVILQALSPQVKKQNPEYVKGAEEGDIFNTVTKELFKGDEGVYFIPTGFEPLIVEWKPREKGGGLVAFHKDRATIGETSRNDKNQEVNKAGNVIQPTNYHYGKYLDKDGNVQFAIIAMASTQLKKSKNWNTQIMSIRMKDASGKSFVPASYSHQYKLTTTPESNNFGNWMGWVIENAGVMQNYEVYMECKLHSQQVREGQLKLTNTPSDVEPEANATSLDNKGEY